MSREKVSLPGIKSDFQLVIIYETLIARISFVKEKYLQIVRKED